MNYAIIAAGEGSRLVSEGVELPKPLVDLDGRPMIKRLIDIFVANGAGTISVIVNGQMTQVADYLRGIAPGLPCRFNLVVRSTPSSMHSFYEVSRVFEPGSKFILTTVDTIFSPEALADYARAFESAGADIDGCMGVTGFVDDEKPLWVATGAGDIITGYYDTPHPDAHYISAGVYGLTTAALDVLKECMDSGVSRMRNYQRALIGAGMRLKAFDLGKVIDVDHAGDIATARRFLGV